MRVLCHGGPLHGDVVEVVDGHNHFHIVAPDERKLVSFTEEEDIRQIETFPTREGTYSQVAGYPGNFEWDGWVTHA